MTRRCDACCAGVGSARRGAALLLVFFIVDAPLWQPLIGHVIALVGALWIASTILRAREEPA